VTLRFDDGSFEVTGPLLGFDGLSYRIDTRFGVLTIAAHSVSCIGACPARGDAVRVRLIGATALAEVLMPAMVDAFARSLGLVSQPVPAATRSAVALAIGPANGQALDIFEVEGVSSAAGFQALIGGTADIVLADRPLSEAERARALAAELGDLADPLPRRLVARRPLGIVASRDVGQINLDVAELVALFSGDIASWAALGGPDAPVRLALPEVDAAAFAYRLGELGDIVASPRDPVQLAPDLTVLEGTEALVSFLETEPGEAVLTHDLIFSGRPVTLSHGCVAGSAEAAEGAAYPLMTDLWLYTAAPRLPDLARAFLVFSTGPEAQRVVDRAGFVDKCPRPVPLDAQGNRMAQAVLALDDAESLIALQGLVAELADHERLSISFRFDGSGIEMSAASASEAQSLAAILDSGRLDGRRLVFLGFTDADGSK